MGFHGKVIVFFAVILLAALAAIFLFGTRQSTEIEQVVRHLEKLVQKRDVASCMGYVYEEYSHEGQSYEDLERLTRSSFGNADYGDVSVRDLETSQHGDDGTAHFILDVEAELAGRKIPLTVTLFFRKFGPDWKIVGYNMKNEMLWKR